MLKLKYTNVLRAPMVETSKQPSDLSALVNRVQELMGVTPKAATPLLCQIGKAYYMLRRSGIVRYYPKLYDGTIITAHDDLQLNEFESIISDNPALQKNVYKV